MYFREWQFCFLIKISLKFIQLLLNSLAPNRRQGIIWINADPVHWRIFMALGDNELKEEAKASDTIIHAANDMLKK